MTAVRYFGISFLNDKHGFSSEFKEEKKGPIGLGNNLFLTLYSVTHFFTSFYIFRKTLIQIDDPWQG